MKFFVAALVVAIIVVGVSADDENPWDGSWVKNSLRRSPYDPHQCGVDQRQICEESHSQKVNKYVWKPSPAYPFQNLPFDGEKLSSCLSGKKIFLHGDSLIRNLQQSMSCLSPPHVQSSFEYDQSPFICSPSPSPLSQGIFGKISNNFPSDASLKLRVLDYSQYGMVVIGTGLWYTVPHFDGTQFICQNPLTDQPCDLLRDAYPACLHKLSLFLETKLKLFPKTLFVWSSKLPRHYTAESTPQRYCNIPDGPTSPWSSDPSEKFRNLEQEALKPLKKYANFLYFDHHRMSSYRTDGHPGHDQNSDFGGDCSHFCLPGIPDFWSAFLQQHYCFFANHNRTVFFDPPRHEIKLFPGGFGGVWGKERRKDSWKEGLGFGDLRNRGELGREGRGRFSSKRIFKN